MTDDKEVKKPSEKPEETKKPGELSVEQLENVEGGIGPIGGGASLGMD
jgi:hypothetical protein